MKTTIQSPLSFECEYDILSDNICLYQINVIQDSFYAFTEEPKDPNEPSYSSYSHNKAAKLDPIYFGIATEESLKQFITYPSKEGLKSIKESLLSSNTEYYQYFLCESKELDNLVNSSTNDEQLYLKFIEGCVPLELTSINYSHTMKALSEGCTIIRSISSRHSDNHLLVFNLQNELLYFQTYLHLGDSYFFTKDPINFWSKKNQTLFNFTLTDNILENKALFFNQILKVQQEESLFNPVSLLLFFQDHVREAANVIKKNIVEPTDFIKLKDLVHDDENDFRRPDRQSFLMLNNISSSSFLKTQEQTAIIFEDVHPYFKFDTNNVINTLLLAEQKVYEKIGINFENYCNLSYAIEEIDQDDDYDEIEHNKEKNLAHAHINNLLNKMVLNNYLHKELVNNTSIRKYKI